ncbi:coiled-coil domain-containing protein 138 isoform X5 [Petaurus breviceps papuanus]|uniref:coiled-coil domain-containing protein 138 isoform X5 n=1 Tax=Petaurus breviceps papuanus TaxID=3040969 RepID=UPI0036DCB118
MEPKIVKPPGQDAALERLKNRYGIGSTFPYEFVGLDNQVRCKSRRSLTYTDVLDNSSSDPVMSLPTDSAASFSQNTGINSTKPLCDLFKKNVNCLDDDLDYFCDLSPLEVEEELVEDDHSINIAQTIEPFTKQTPPDITLLSNSVLSSEYFYDGYCSPLKYTDKAVSSSKLSNKLKQSSLPPHISQIYNELSLIHQKLQQETAGQQEFAAQLHKREHFLSQKEELLIQHEVALTKIKSVEEEIHTKFQIMKEHHIEEIKRLTEALKEKTKENKRLKSSFDTLKELNDTLKKQLNDVSEQNKKMEVQAKRVQGRLDNLQRKCDFVTVRKCKAISSSLHEMKTTKQEEISTSRINKHSAMTATMRRLGEELFKGVTTGTRDAFPELFIATKPKTAVFFKSPNLSLRFLSTLIVLKTVTQVDYLAQAFDSLCLDLKMDEGKALFLEYQAVPVILNHLKITNKGLLSNVMDSLLQMTVESRFLQPFLEACSNVLFFRTCSVLLRHPKLDLQILEKLSIILQKLSKIKSNKKLFELFTLHLMLQEIQRTANPEHIFLCINLNSTLFNLGVTKCNALVTTSS